MTKDEAKQVLALAKWHSDTSRLWPLGMGQSDFHRGASLLLHAIMRREVGPTVKDSLKVHYDRGYAVALSDAEEAIDDECRERVVTASDCIELIRNLGSEPEAAPAELISDAEIFDTWNRTPLEQRPFSESLILFARALLERTR